VVVSDRNGFVGDEPEPATEPEPEPLDEEPDEDLLARIRSI
jgi:hypothetical protein